MKDGPLTGRRLIAGTLAAAALVALPAAPAVAGSTTKLRILDDSQRAILKKGVRVEVDSATAGTVQVSVSSSTFDDRKAKLTKKHRVRFRQPGSEVVKLGLTKAGKQDVRSCSERALTVKAGSAKDKAELTRDSAVCKLPKIDLSAAGDCDYIAEPDNPLCMLPFPDDYYTRADAGSPTGRRVDFTSSGLPANASGAHLDAASYNASDGFSQGSTIVLKVPGIDTAADVTANGLVPINHIGRYTDADQRVVVIDAKTGERWPIWAEIDSNATDPSKAALEIHPAKNFDSGGHYIVALRNLETGAGAPIEAPAGFRYFRDGMPSKQKEIDDRRPAYEQTFKTLRNAGIRRDGLYLAWDFTAASDQNGYQRALEMRDQAFATLGDTTMADGVVQGSSPQFTVTSVTNFTLAQNAQIARRIDGTYEVPCFMTPDCAPGGVSNLDAGGVPRQNGVSTAPFECTIPRIGVDGLSPQPLVPYVYGHGLFGDGTQIRGSVNPQLQNQYGFVGCATDEIGMSNKDLGTIAGVLGNLANFARLPDRLEQGLINELFLERLMFHPQGLGTDAAFHVDGTLGTASVLRTDHVYYMGASQGGIMGGALMAISPDAVQGSLLVGAMNYSVLLPRSVDYAPYASLLNNAYTDELARPLLFSIIQMLWDRGEPDGYAHVMTTNPPPNTPAHNISLMAAVGDHQVTNYASEVEARTAGLKAHDPVIDAARWADYDPLVGVPRLTAADYPFHGSSFIYLDGGPMRADPNDPSKTIGTPTPPFENLPNTQGEDPHGAPRGADAAVAMTATMLQPNGFIDEVCGGRPCYGGGWTGLP
ncbi:MAG: hypothetical protein QOI10_2378 [Solirubrobacterales bacterium]|jgi:hypothetical protein|nr:hypothetical protein [Solirubrobacterales bacterium]